MKLFAQKDTLLTEGSIHKKIILFAIPIFIGQLFQQLYNTVDSLIVGNFVGHSALAAVTSTGTLVFLLIGFFFGFSIGSASRAVLTAVAIGLFFSVVITVLGTAFSPALLRLIGTPEDVFEQASLYLRIYFAGSAGLILYNTFVGILQASGDSRHPLVYLIISSLVNVVLDIFFITVFKMGVDGAALATVLSQFLRMSLALRRLLRADSAIKIEWRKIRAQKQVVMEIVKYGLPTALQGCIVDLSNILIQSYINSFGSFAMAGMGAYSKIEGFAFLPVIAFSMAMTTFISQNLGAGNKERMRRGMFFGLSCAVIMIEVIGLIVFLGAPFFIKGFNPEPEVVRIGTMRAHICSLFFCLMGFSNVTAAVLRGLGKPMAPMVVMLLCWCGVRVAVFMTIGKLYHNILLTAWIYPITWSLSTLVYTVLLVYYRKKQLY